MLTKIQLSWRKALIVAPLISLVCLQSCRKTEINQLNHASISDVKNAQIKLEPLSIAEKSKAMEDFATLLSKAVKDNPELRIFLKNEALKKFDLDYDVLYHLVKDKRISDKGTFKQILIKAAESEHALDVVENNIPLLTIMIPELPGEVSAETWKAESVVPIVSTGRVIDKKVLLRMPNGSIEHIEHDLTPGYPMLVVKENDRILLFDGKSNERPPAERASTFSSDKFNFEFLAEDFNGTKSNIEYTTASLNYDCFGCDVPAKTATAYQLWAYDYPTQQLWQRDYVYYTISPLSPNGPLDVQYQEHLTGLRFQNAWAAYKKISDQAEDPLAGDIESNLSWTADWTEGHYEIGLTALTNSTSGLGPQINKKFPVNPSLVFDRTYIIDGWFFQYPLYKLTGVTAKQVSLNTVIAAWDIKTSSIAWKIMLSEVDLSQSAGIQESHSSQIAGNFAIDGIQLKKIGLKFGLSQTIGSSVTYTLNTQMDDDDLGEAAIYFYDPIIVYDDIIPNQGPMYEFKTIDTGWAWLVIQPKPVY